nr:reverse transcriptase domain-containing protein [Tanacetum cinerariifolium]
MQTRSSSRLVSNLSSNPTPSTNPNLKGRNRRRSKQRIEDLNLEELSTPIVTMADQRTMAQLLQAPTEGYEDAIVVPAITADNFELKHDQDSLNSVAGGNFLNKMPRECLAIIESKSKVRYSRNKPVVTKVSTNTSTSGISPNIAELTDMVKALLLYKKATDGNVYRDNIREFVSQAFAVNYNQGNTSYHPLMMSNQIRPPGFPPVPNNQNVQLNQRTNQNPYLAPAYQAPAPQTQGVSKEDFSAYVKANDAVMRNMQTQGQNMQNQLTNLTDLITKFVNFNSASTLSSGTLPSNIIANLRSDLKAITTRSGVSYDEPQISPSTSFLHMVVEDEPEATKDTVNPTNNESTKDVQPQVVQSESPVLTSKPVTSPISKPAFAPVSATKPNPKSSIPYPSRRNDERNHEKANNQIEKFYQIFKDMSFEISFTDALILMPKFASTLKALIGNKEKLRDPGKFLIPCDFPGVAECLALVALGASINLMPFFVWKRLSLLDLTPTCMTLKLADHLISHSVGVAEDVYVKTERALIDVFKGDLTLRVGKEGITFNLEQTLRYSANYSDMTAKRIDAIDIACEEYSQEVLGFSDTISSGNPTLYYDPIVSTTSMTLTPFRKSDFLLEEVDAFLAIKDDPSSPEFYQPYLDPERDILLLEAFLNDDPSLPPPNQGNYLPEVRTELKIYEAKSDKSSVDEPPEEKTALITVLKSHKRAIAWKLSDIKGIDPEFCTHKILMKEDFKPAVQHQRRVNTKIHDVIKQEVIKLLEAGLIYLISDSPWVSPVHCVPKKGGFTVVENKDNELIPTRLVTGWRVCIDYHKLNEATRKDHFPLLFIDQMLERLEGNQYYCFHDGFSGYFQNSHRSERSGENHIHLPIRNVCLSPHAFWAMQCSRHVSESLGWIVIVFVDLVEYKLKVLWQKEDFEEVEDLFVVAFCSSYLFFVAFWFIVLRCVLWWRQQVQLTATLKRTVVRIAFCPGLRFVLDCFLSSKILHFASEALHFVYFKDLAFCLWNTVFCLLQRSCILSLKHCVLSTSKILRFVSEALRFVSKVLRFVQIAFCPRSSIAFCLTFGITFCLTFGIAFCQT